MMKLSKIAVYIVRAVNRLEGGLFRYRGTPSVFSGGGLASAVWSFDWTAFTTSLPQVAFLMSLILLIAAMNGGSGLGELSGARRALGF